VDLGLRDRVVVIGGSSRGIGRATAEAFAAEGARVVLNGRDEAALEEAREAVGHIPGTEVEAVVADLSSDAGARGLIDRAMERFGRIDVLVSNAGGPPAGAFETLTDEQWLAGFDLVVLSTVRLIRAALPHLRETRGSIVVINSTAALNPVHPLTLSNVLRPAQLGVARTLTPELAESGIRINEVGPGLIWTDRQRYLTEVRAERSGVSLEDEQRRALAGVPLGRYGRPQDIARTAVFLASSAAEYITGQIVMVDGGRFPS